MGSLEGHRVLERGFVVRAVSKMHQRGVVDWL